MQDSPHDVTVAAGCRLEPVGALGWNPYMWPLCVTAWASAQPGGWVSGMNISRDGKWKLSVSQDFGPETN